MQPSLLAFAGKAILSLVCALTLGLLSHQSARAADPSQATLSPTALFYRCYGDIVGKRPVSDHPMLLKVKAGTLTPINACLELLKKARFDATGMLPPAMQRDDEALRILTRFYQFHRLWFDVADFSGRPQTYSSGELRHNDQTEPALVLTRALFQPGVPYKDVVSGTSAVRGIRSLGAWQGSKQLTVPEAGLQRGTLLGITSYPSGHATYYTDVGVPITTLTIGSSPVTSKRSYGAGIAGLQSYFFMNSGFPKEGGSDDPAGDPSEGRSSISNASIRMHRRWAKNVMSDLLCRELPALRAVDVNSMVIAYLQAYPDSTKRLPFRENTSCMSCHATIDPMAATARSLYFKRVTDLDWNGSGGVTSDDRHTILAAKATDLAAETVPEYSLMQRDRYFARRPSSGSLRFRSYDGEKTWIDIKASGNLDGLQALGNAMADTKDLYVCAASRYFDFFTGIKPNLMDEGDPSNGVLSAEDRYYRDEVVKIGLRFKVHQNLETLIEEILESDIYKKTGMRDVAQ